MIKTLLTLLCSLVLGGLSFYILIEYKGQDAGFYVACLFLLLAGVCALKSLDAFIDWCCDEATPEGEGTP